MKDNQKKPEADEAKQKKTAEAEENNNKKEDIDVSSDSGKKKKNGRWSKLKKWQKALIIAVIVILVLALLIVAVVWGVWNFKIRKRLDKSKLGVTNDIYEKYGDTDIMNILVFGVDSREEDSFKGLSDTIIILSIDAKNGSIKLTSILRDSYVPIEGHGSNKINSAYSWGGPELAIKTVNQNFRMNITDYATINMWKMADAIDVLGGIDIEITESEKHQINDEALGGTQKGAALLHEYGKVHLDGDQATIYCRLRKQDSDEVRAQRQKKVLLALLAQARKVSPSKYADVVRTMLSLCETSVSFETIMKFVPLINADLKIEQINIPAEPEKAYGGALKNYKGNLIKHSNSDMWVWVYDLTAASNRIHEFIYGEVPAKVPETQTQQQRSASTTAPSRSNGNSSGNSGGSRSGETTTLAENYETTTLAPPDTGETVTDTSQPETQQTTVPPETTQAAVEDITARQDDPPTEAASDDAA